MLYLQFPPLIHKISKHRHTFFFHLVILIFLQIWVYTMKLTHPFSSFLLYILYVFNIFCYSFDCCPKAIFRISFWFYLLYVQKRKKRDRNRGNERESNYKISLKSWNNSAFPQIFSHLVSHNVCCGSKWEKNALRKNLNI